MAIFWLYPMADASDSRFSAYYRMAVVTAVMFAMLLWRMNRGIAAFFLLAAVSSVFPFSTKYSTEAIRTIFVGCLWFYFIARLPRHTIEWLYGAICIIGIFNAIMVISQFCGFDPRFTPRHGDGIPIVGFASNQNEIAALLAFCLPAFFRAKWKWFIPLIVISAMISRCSAGVVSMLCVFVMYLFITGMIRKYWYWVVISMVGAVGYIYWDASGEIIPYSLYDRFNAWKLGLKIYSKKFLTGFGIGHWKGVFSQKPVINAMGGQWWSTSHNEYLQCMFEMGIFSVVIFAWYFCSVIVRYFRNKQEMIIPVCAMTAIAVNSIVNFPFHIAQTAIIALTWMGIIEIINAESIKRNI